MEEMLGQPGEMMDPKSDCECCWSLLVSAVSLTFIGLRATPHSRQSFLGGGEILFLCFIKTIRNINLASQTAANILYHISYQTTQKPNTTSTYVQKTLSIVFQL